MSAVFVGGVDRFAWAWAFLLLIPVVMLVIRRAVVGGRSRAPMGIPSFGSPGLGIPGTLASRTSWVPMGLRVAALCALVVAIARPQEVSGKSETRSEGVAIQILIDRSSSMAEGMVYDGERVTRLEAAKRAARAFVAGDGGELGGRAGDLVGVVTFARFADTVCPLVLEHASIPELLEGVELTRRGSTEDGTAIGDAIALAAARLRDAERRFDQRNREGDRRLTIKSKAIVLMTDGANTAGAVSPVTAARLSAEWGIKIYAIGIGEPARSRGLFGVRGGVDERLLKLIADETGGEAYLVNSADGLGSVYEEIDSLERSEIRTDSFTDVRELFVTPALIGVVLVGVERLLAGLWYRRVF